MNNDITFQRGEDNLLKSEKPDRDPCDLIKIIKNRLSQLFNLKNIHFLLGAGASADALPTMQGLLSIIEEKINKNGDEEQKRLFDKIKKHTTEKAKTNLESILSVLYSGLAYSKGTGDQEDSKNDKLIEFIKDEIIKQLSIDLDSEEAKKSINIYKEFYNKLSLRDKNLSRLNVFTTNYDLFNEAALSELNINFNNGFSSGLHKVFNPARFSYTLSCKLDSTIEKYEPLENMVYLYKLHGSINWIQNEKKSFFNIEEIDINYQKDNTKNEKRVLIYPTQLKQNMSLGSPYTDLIREFHKKLLLNNSVLIIIGYGFGDEHINNIIYTALASNTSLNIVIFGDHEEEILTKIPDSRIYRISGKTPEEDNIHYFKYIVENLIPNLKEDKEDKVIRDFIDAFHEQKKDKENKMKTTTNEENESIHEGVF